MVRAYKPMLPLWYVETKLKLSDAYPSGLEWVEDAYYHRVGDMAGKWTTPGDYYLIRMNGDQFHAHRLVYYLRTGIDPGNADILYGPSNKEKDNRKELILYIRPQSKRTRKRQLETVTG